MIEATKDLSSYRRYFPMVEKTKYFMTNSLGAMPSTVGPALQEMMKVWVEQGAEAWDHHWVPMMGQVGDQMGRLIGAKPGTVAMHLNVSSLLAMVLSSFDFKKSKRNKIVYSSMEFPTLHYLSDTWQKYGARFEVVPSRDGVGVNLEDFLAAIDEETLLVPTCHVFFGSSYKQDLAAITKRCHEVGAMIVADVYQSAGSMPIDVTALNVDFAIGGSHKYLCGGTGAGWLYTRPDHLSHMNPAVTGWLSHPNAFAMKIEPMAWAPGTQRYMGGTPSVAPLYVAPCGYKIIEEIGTKRIREESVKHTERMIHWADEFGLEVRSPRDEKNRGGSVHVRFKGVETASPILKEKGFLVHYREAYQGLRISPHFYNTIDEIDGLMKELGTIAKRV
jgi:kynureninase